LPVIEALSVLGKLGYKLSGVEFDDRLKLWWKGSDSRYDDGLKQLHNDKDALGLASYDDNKCCAVEIYGEHRTSVAITGINEEPYRVGKVIDKGKGIF
jgi:hypothetical protein